jgi:hypothetical protein
MSGDLIAFLNARLNEDEREMPEMLWGETAADNDRNERKARTLREVAAKRAMLAELTRPPFDYRPGCNDRTRLFVHLLASVYSDNPDYQAEWKP